MDDDDDILSTPSNAHSSNMTSNATTGAMPSNATSTGSSVNATGTANNNQTEVAAAAAISDNSPEFIE
jgi:hypothetical protein